MFLKTMVGSLSHDSSMTCLFIHFLILSRKKEKKVNLCCHVTKLSLKNRFLNKIFCRLVTKLEESAPDQVAVFKTNTNSVMKDILGRFKDLQFFTGESMDCEGMIAMMEYRDIDGDSVPVLMCFKHGLDEEKF